MDSQPWLKIGDRVLNLDDLPGLLERSGLMLPLMRRIVLESCLASVQVSSEEQSEFHRKFLADQGISSHEELTAWLNERGLDEEQASRNVVEALRIERFKNDRFLSQVDQVFLETKDSRDRVVYSMLRVASQPAAIELHTRLAEEDATFTDLCQEHSIGSERETGGLIGPIELSRLQPDIAEALRISNPGKLWPPMQIADVWVVLRLDKKFPAKLDDGMRRRIRDELFDTWISKQCASLMSSYGSALKASDNE